MKTKVKALTLNEMVIVMIITTIVVGLAFTVLSIIQRHMWSIKQNFSLNTELNRLEEVLWIDANNYNTISYNKEESMVKFKTVLDSMTYQFHKDYVLRDKDTFYLQIAYKAFYFNGAKVTEGKVDAIDIKLSKKYRDQRLFVFKINDAKQFID